MKLKSFILSCAIVLCIFCGCTAKENTDKNVSENKTDTKIQQIMEIVSQQEGTGYKLVQPDRSDLQMIPCDLEYILSMFQEDYDCTKDNIYDYLFKYNQLDYVYPNYLDEVVFESEPLQNSEWGSSRWYLLDVPQKDPLGKFPQIPPGCHPWHRR